LLLQEEALAIYIYGLHCPVAGTIRYVGKSTKPAKRLNAHMCGAKSFTYSHHTARWLRKLDASGLRPSVVILHECQSGERWQDVERQFIASAAERGWQLTNSTAGGEGLDYTDPVAEAAYRAKLSASLKAVWSTPERRQEARERSQAIAADKEALAKRNEAIRLAYANPEVRQKFSAINTEIGSRPEVKAAKSSASRGHWRRSEYRAAIVAARNDPAFTVEQGNRLRKRWADPDARKKMNSARWTPEKRREQADRIRAHNRNRSTKG
jgi:hypothetical protein